jgi:acyl-CoA thioester hydrolase
MTIGSSFMSTKRLVHVTRMPIRWGDMDAMGHVNNAVYFRYMEHARIEWLTHIACAPNPDGEGPVIINANCTFLRQLKYPGEIEVRTFVGEMGRSSFDSYHEIRRADDPDTLVAQGGAKIVWVNMAMEKSVPLTDELKKRITKEA